MLQCTLQLSVTARLLRQTPSFVGRSDQQPGVSTTHPSETRPGVQWTVFANIMDSGQGPLEFAVASVGNHLKRDPLAIALSLTSDFYYSERQHIPIQNNGHQFSYINGEVATN